MVTIQKVDNAIRFTFESSSFYLYDNGTVDVPLNALTLVLDEADMANFVKASSNDNLFSIPMSELSQFADKAALQSWFEENAFGSAGISPEDVQTAIDTALAPVNEDITDLSNEMAVKEEVTARALTDLQENKLDKDDYTPVTVDSTLDSDSANPVANSAITAGIAAKIDDIRTSTSVDAYSKPTGIISQYKGNSGTGKAVFGSINGVRILQGSDAYHVNHFNLVETSAITTSLTASSTDAQVPSAKAVYDAIEQQQQNYYAKSDIDNASNAVAQALIELQERLGGLTLVKLTQAEYDALSVKDSNTLYIISNVVNS